MEDYGHGAGSEQWLDLAYLSLTVPDAPGASYQGRTDHTMPAMLPLARQSGPTSILSPSHRPPAIPTARLPLLENMSLNTEIIPATAQRR